MIEIYKSINSSAPPIMNSLFLFAEIVQNTQNIQTAQRKQ